MFIMGLFYQNEDNDGLGGDRKHGKGKLAI